MVYKKMVSMVYKKKYLDSTLILTIFYLSIWTIQNKLQNM